MRSIRIIVGVSVFYLLFSLPAMAQTTTSTIEGTVTDAIGAVIAGAEVKASGIDARLRAQCHDRRRRFLPSHGITCGNLHTDDFTGRLCHEHLQHRVDAQSRRDFRYPTASWASSSEQC